MILITMMTVSRELYAGSQGQTIVEKVLFDVMIMRNEPKDRN